MTPGEPAGCPGGGTGMPTMQAVLIDAVYVPLTTQDIPFS